MSTTASLAMRSLMGLKVMLGEIDRPEALFQAFRSGCFLPLLTNALGLTSQSLDRMPLAQGRRSNGRLSEDFSPRTKSLSREATSRAIAALHTANVISREIGAEEVLKGTDYLCIALLWQIFKV